MNNLQIKTRRKKEVVDLTERVNEVIEKEGFREGVCVLFVEHTTCCLTTGEVGEGTDEDFLRVAEKIIPHMDFQHGHDPSREHVCAHMTSSLIGPSLTLPVQQSRLALGTWQRVMLVELDGPRERNIYVTLINTKF